MCGVGVGDSRALSCECLSILARRERSEWPRLTSVGGALGPPFIPEPTFLASETDLSTMFHAALQKPSVEWRFLHRGVSLCLSQHWRAAGAPRLWLLPHPSPSVVW